MPSDVTLQLNNPGAWETRLTFDQSKAAGTAYDSVMMRNYPNRAATCAAIPVYGLAATISFSSGYQVYVAAFDTDMNYLGYNESGSSRGWKSSPYTFSSANAEYICIAVKSSPEAEFTDAMFEDMDMTLTLAGGGGSMTESYTRQEAYDLNGLAGWESFTFGSGKYSDSRFRNAGGGNGTRTWGLSEASLPMDATGYMRIDTTSATNSDNTIAQDFVPLVTGEVYTIGAFVRGKGYFTCGPTQDGYYRARREYVNHQTWRFYGGEFTAKSASQSMYWRNETIGTDEYAGSLEICAPLLVAGGVLAEIIATDSRTLAVTVDVQKVETYYYQTASTGSQPERPATASPSGWQTTEFAFDSSMAIWSCQKTTLTDGTFFWGEVSKASAYQGAVVSYNEAQSAKQVATSYIFKTTGHDAWVCDEDAGPDPSTGEAYGPSATSPTTGWRIGDVFEMVRQGVSWFKLWVGSNAAKLRLGRDDSGHVVLGDDGMEVFADGTSMAEFGRSGARIGKPYVEGATDNESHMELDYHSLQMMDKEGDTYFHVSDLRGTDGVAEIVDTFTGNGTTKTFILSLGASSKDYTVSVSDSSGGTVTKGVSMVVFQSAPTADAIITVTYSSESPYAKAYTLGLRNSSGDIGAYSLVEGRDNTASGNCSHAEGYQVTASGNYSHAEGRGTTASGANSHAEGYYNTASGYHSHAEGDYTTASGTSSHAEGRRTTASGSGSHAEGESTTASRVASHAEGRETTASGSYSHAEGDHTTASGNYSHAEGFYATASGDYSHAEGDHTTASGANSHAEGHYSTASGDYSHAEGNCGASGANSHAEGLLTAAGGSASHAQNCYTLAASDNQTAIGKYNRPDPNGAYALIVGNGTSATARSNAAVIDWLGNYIAQGWAGITQMFAGAVTQTVDSDGVATATGAPAGWLLCDGSAVSRTTYSTLFTAIGTTWGAGDGSTTFNLPDLRGRAPIGAGTGSGLTARTLGNTLGSESLQAHTHDKGTLAITSSGGHKHPINTKYDVLKPGTSSGTLVSLNSGGSRSGSNVGSVYINDNTGAHTHPNGNFSGDTGPAGAGDAQNMQPSAVVNFIIHTGSKTS